MIKALFAKGTDKTMYPVSALNDWINTAEIFSADAFLLPQVRKNGNLSENHMTPQSVVLVIKRYTDLAGLKLDMAGHSLRRGFVTEALRQGASERSVMHQTGHKSVAVMRGYQELFSAVEDNAASLI